MHLPVRGLISGFGMRALAFLSFRLHYTPLSAAVPIAEAYKRQNEPYGFV